MVSRRKEMRARMMALHRTESSTKYGDQSSPEEVMRSKGGSHGGRTERRGKTLNLSGLNARSASRMKRSTHGDPFQQRNAGANDQRNATDNYIDAQHEQRTRRRRLRNTATRRGGERCSERNYCENWGTSTADKQLERNRARIRTAARMDP